MRVKINGKEKEIAQSLTLFDLIKGQNLNAEKIVIEHNGEIVDKSKLENINLSESDIIEIISFVGGG